MHEGMFVQTLLTPGQKPVNELAEPTPS